MGCEFEYVPVTVEKSPDRAQACQMLREIASRPAAPGPRRVDKDLVLYGAGDLGKMAREYFDCLSIPFLCVIDAKPDLARKDPFWSGVEILSPQEATVSLRKTALLAICIATLPFTQLAGALRQQGWQDVVPFYDIAEAYHDRHPLSNGWYSGTLSDQDLFAMDSVLYRWQDDISRAHHLQFAAWRRLREEWFFTDAPVTIRDRYFIPEVLSVLNDQEIFVDVGSHYGEALLKFLQHVEQRFRGIYAIEPDEENLAHLLANLGAGLKNDERFHPLNLAIGAVAGNRPFYQGLGYVSQFSDLVQSNISVSSLDELALPATFLKIHIEGWESSAISGSLATIRNQRPILTVTSYHNREGLWYIPAQLMTSLEDYVFYFRLHSWQDGCGVIYALPKERERTL